MPFTAVMCSWCEYGIAFDPEDNFDLEHAMDHLKVHEAERHPLPDDVGGEG